MDLPSITPDKLNDTHQHDQKTICIIGAGPVGLAALKVILDAPQFKSGLWKPIAFESRDKVGGIWNPAPPTDEPPLTPLYDSLTTNLPHPIMAFTSYSFPPSTPVFPHASVVQKYLESYADHFRLLPYIQFNTTVSSVVYNAPRWRVKTSKGEILEFDLALVCNGHYRIPRYPSVPGIAEWLNNKRASHAAWYRRPHDYGKVILVVGAGPSGQDISAELMSVACTVIHSVTGGSIESIGKLKRKGRVSQFGPVSEGQVIFEDGSVESGIDYCILATGYEVSFPFLQESVIRTEIPPPVPPLPRDLYNSTYGVFPLADHLHPLQSHYLPTTIAFLGMLVRVAPFPLVEAQARAALQSFAHPDTFNPMQEAVGVIMRNEDLRAELGTDDPLLIAKAWHRFKPHEQFDYRDKLCEYAESGGDNMKWGKVRVQNWEKEMYDKKDVLRKVWRELEASGEAEGWVQGVGEGGPHEWVELLRRMLKRADERHIMVKEVDKANL